MRRQIAVEEVFDEEGLDVGSTLPNNVIGFDTLMMRDGIFDGSVQMDDTEREQLDNLRRLSTLKGGNDAQTDTGLNNHSGRPDSTRRGENFKCRDQGDEDHRDNGYCEPTSSRTRIEDLTTSADELREEWTRVLADLKEKGHEAMPRFGSIVPGIDGMIDVFDSQLPLEARLVMQAMSEHALHVENERLTYYPDSPDETEDSTIHSLKFLNRPEIVGYQDFSSKHFSPTDRARSRKMTIATETYYEQDEWLYAMIDKNDARITGQRDKKYGNNGKTRHSGYTNNDIPRLRDQWYTEYGDMMAGVPEELPPLRDVNHEINLVDENKRYLYHKPSCPESLRLELREKTERYVRAEWWVPTAVIMAAPVLCLRKKDGHLRTVMDLRQRNDNTIKDITPMPDQDTIRDDVARARYRSKIDLSDAYEQVLILARDRHKTAFRTVTGTYLSNVMQQGDCNAPATFQRLMNFIFQDVIGSTLR